MKGKRVGKKLKILLGMAAILGGAAFGCLYYFGMSGLHGNTEPQPGQIRVACVGDSITYGAGLTDWRENNYPAVLAGLLPGYHVANFGVSSTCAQSGGDEPYGDTKTCRESLEYGADILVFMLGTNDSKPGNWQGPEAFREGYLALLDRYLAGEKKPVVFLCTPPAAFFPEGRSGGTTYYNIQPEVVERIAETVRQIAAERGYPLIDLYEATMDQREWISVDCVHPNAEGAAAIAEAVANILEE